MAGMASDPIADAITNYKLSIANAAARLAELDLLSTDQQMSMTFSLGVMTYDVTGYRNALVAQIAGAEAAIKSLVALSWQGQSVFGVVR